MRRNKKRRELKLPDNLNFHYSREERYDLLSETERAKFTSDEKGFFKKNRSAKFIITDIIIIVLFFGGWQIYSKFINCCTELAGCSFELTGFAYDGKIMAALYAERKNKAGDGEEKAEITFISGNEKMRIFAILPEDQGESEIFRSSLALPSRTADKYELKAEIATEKERKTIAISVKGEK